MARSAEFFDHLFPEAGGWEKLRVLRIGREREAYVEVPLGENKYPSAFTQLQLDHINKAFRALEGDDEAKATLALVLTFTQTKHDVAGF